MCRTYAIQYRSIVGTKAQVLTMNDEKITLRLPSSFIRQLDFLVKVEDFSSRSEAIRIAVRDMLYHRLDLVMEKIEKKVKANQKMMEFEALEDQYLKYLKK